MTIGRWELGKDDPPVEGLIRLSRLYAVGLDWLLTGEAAGSDASVTAVVRRAHAPLETKAPAAEVARDVGMAWSILESGKGQAKALAPSIHQLYAGAFGMEALVEQVGIDGLEESDRAEYLAKGKRRGGSKKAQSSG